MKVWRPFTIALVAAALLGACREKSAPPAVAPSPPAAPPPQASSPPSDAAPATQKRMPTLKVNPDVFQHELEK